MNNSHFILALTGPAGAGKSTVGERLAKQFEKCVNIDADSVKHMVVSGFYFDKYDPDNDAKWGFSEWALVGESIGLLAQNFMKHGFDVIINGYIDAPAWESIEKLTPVTHKVLLLPHVDAVIARDQGRIPDVQQGEASVRRHHHHFSTDEFFKDFATVDTTNHSIDETVNEVRKVLE